MKIDSNTVLIIVVTLIVALGAYWYFFTGTADQAPLTIVTTENPVQTQFQILVSQLQPISFDTAILSDARFMSLVNLATPITPESSGRLDPFASLVGTK
ncbi:MAG: hypothetical protein NUV60_03175 [Patescibacteria group bacterium]|nr:hypothetical protein [Patescibacteria group bacterium]